VNDDSMVVMNDDSMAAVNQSFADYFKDLCEKLRALESVTVADDDLGDLGGGEDVLGEVEEVEVIPQVRLKRVDKRTNRGRKRTEAQKKCRSQIGKLSRENAKYSYSNHPNPPNYPNPPNPN